MTDIIGSGFKSHSEQPVKSKSELLLKELALKIANEKLIARYDNNRKAFTFDKRREFVELMSEYIKQKYPYLKTSVSNLDYNPSLNTEHPKLHFLLEIKADNEKSGFFQGN